MAPPGLVPSAQPESGTARLSAVPGACRLPLPGKDAEGRILSFVAAVDSLLGFQSMVSNELEETQNCLVKIL